MSLGMSREDYEAERKEFDRLFDAAWDLLDFVVEKHPEIRQQQEFNCPKFQAVAESLQYFKEEEHSN